MIYDPTLQVPDEIIEAARKIDEWAKSQGFQTYKIGPVQNRICEEDLFLELKEVIRKWEARCT